MLRNTTAYFGSECSNERRRWIPHIADLPVTKPTLSRWMYWLSVRSGASYTASFHNPPGSGLWRVELVWLYGDHRDVVTELEHPVRDYLALDTEKQQLYLRVDNVLKRMHVNGSGLEVREGWVWRRGGEVYCSLNLLGV